MKTLQPIRLTNHALWGAITVLLYVAAIIICDLLVTIAMLFGFSYYEIKHILMRNL